MKTTAKTLATATCVLAMTFAAASVSAANVSVNIDGDSLFKDDNSSVELKDNKVIFHHEDRPEAVAFNDGRVRISDEMLELSASQRAVVSDYVEQLRDLRDRALGIAREATHFALDVVWNAIIGAMTEGDNAEQKIEQRADTFEQRVAHKICEPIGALHRLGKQLADSVERLQPYLPSVKTESECMKDALEDD